MFMKKIIFFSIALTVITVIGFANFEPELSSAVSSSTTVTLTVDSEITMTSSSFGNNVVMSPNLSMTQDTSIGSTTINVVTNDTDGYTLNLRAATSTAMKSTTNPANNYFADYSPAVANTPENWTENANAYEFGFGVYGNDIVTGWAAGTSCGTAGANAITSSINWLNASTVDRLVAQKNSATTQAGVDTVVCFGAEQGTNVFAPSGNYSAEIIATAAVQ